MLLDSLIGPDDREELRAVLERRLRYLLSRGETFAERTPDPAVPSWQPALVRATLWMEAAESAVALDEFDAARAHLVRAIAELLRLKLPLGVALQRTFFAGSEELGRSADRVMLSWRARLHSQPEAGTDALPEEGLSGAAWETAQQWVYFALAEAGTDSERPDVSLGSDALAAQMASTGAVPLGRLRLPLGHYLAVAEVSADALRLRGDVRPRRQAQAAEAIAESLVGLYRSLQWARRNSYLWRRLLAPAPMFDLDTALLVARGQQTRATLERSLTERALTQVPPDAAEYAGAFVAAVARLNEDTRGSPRFAAG